VEEDVDRWRVPNIVAQYGEGPHEGPAVRMQQGGGHVDFCQQCPLEADEGEAQLNPFEDGLIEEKKGSPSLARSSAHTGSPLAQG